MDINAILDAFTHPIFSSSKEWFAGGIMGLIVDFLCGFEAEVGSGAIGLSTDSFANRYYIQ